MDRILDLSYSLRTTMITVESTRAIFPDVQCVLFSVVSSFFVILMHRCSLDGTEHQSFCLVQNIMVLQLMFGPLAAYSPNFCYADHFFRLNNLTQLNNSSWLTLILSPVFISLDVIPSDYLVTSFLLICRYAYLFGFLCCRETVISIN